ncbi:MAG: LysM peptidoglycan-binding domain-containing protein [Candidatus Latescibacterota bacterium]|nr:MAG: LysM peptidoglycan-binding domain-containing protein [Candidatus Latescibacterota bacterium]
MADSIKTLLIVVLLGAVVALVGVTSNGCSRSKTRQIDVSQGEYYSEDELLEMSDRKKSAYCQTLQGELTTTQEEFDGKTRELQETKDLTRALRAKIGPIEREVLQLESDIRSLNDLIEEVKALPKTYKVKDGDSLSYISSRPEIYNDIEKWWRIFEANQDKIDDPFYVFPDTTLVIPRDWPTD